MAISSGHLNWTPLAGEGIGRPAGWTEQSELTTAEHYWGGSRTPSKQLGRAGPSVADAPGPRYGSGSCSGAAEYPVQRVDATERPGDDVDVG